jgi:hypothetical protein
MNSLFFLYQLITLSFKPTPTSPLQPGPLYHNRLSTNLPAATPLNKPSKHRPRSISPLPANNKPTKPHHSPTNKRSSSITDHNTHSALLSKTNMHTSSLDHTHQPPSPLTNTINTTTKITLTVADQVNANNSVANSANDIHLKKSHNNLLTISGNQHDRTNSTKSLVSTNSAFSGGFLPSPEAFNQSACSSYSQMQANNNHGCESSSTDSQPVMGGIVALAAATINSSLANLIPVKITVQSDAGLITSFENLDKSKSSEASNEAVGTECQVQEKKATADEGVVVKQPVAAATSASSSAVVAGSRGSGGSGGSVSKPGAEVLTLIATWIKNAPNDFLDTRVIDEIKSFFNQLDSLKSSFRPWTARLKQALNLEVSN